MDYFNRLRIFEGGVASRNPMPDMSGWSGILLEGKYAPVGRGRRPASVCLSHRQLSRGVLVLGRSGSGKTNVIDRMASQILNGLGKDEFAVVLDVKGDYTEHFFADGDWIIDPNSDTFCWNLFDELTPYREDDFRFQMKVHEICEYLYEGRQSTNAPYFVNAAREITECFIKYLIYDSEERGDASHLNNENLARLLRGQLRPDGCADPYESYLTILASYEEFSGARIHIPPSDQRNQSGDGVISEVVSMANDIFVGAFGAGRGGEYVSGARLLRECGGRVLFLRYDPSLSRSSTYVIRLVLDWLLSGCSDPRTNFNKAYFILDEMAVLPRLNYLDRTLNLVRSKNVAIIGALQSVEQMRETYPAAKAKNILDAFQSMIVLNTESESINYVKSRFGSALVQRTAPTSDGGIRMGEMQYISSVEDYEIGALEPGTAFVKLADHRPFRFHFSRYEVTPEPEDAARDDDREVNRWAL